MLNKLLSATLLWLFSTCALAVTTLPEILVSATRSHEPGISIPAAFNIIEREDIVLSGAQNLSQLLAMHVGVHVSDGVGGGGAATIDMRGFGAAAASNIAILIDGHKINPATDISTLYLNTINLDDVERIEIIEGSAGTLYGNQAVGGLINIITRERDLRSYSLRMGTGSYHHHATSLNIVEPLNQNLSLGIQAKHNNSDNYREHNASKVTFLSADLTLQHANKGRTRLTVQRMKDHQETPGALLASELAVDRRQVMADFVNDYFFTDSILQRLSTHYQLNTNWRIENDISLREDNREFIQSFRGSGPSNAVTTQERDSVALNPRLIANLGNNTLTLGGDYQYTDYELSSSFGTTGNKQTISALYTQLQIEPLPQVSITTGLRHAYVDNDINNIGTPVALKDHATIGSLGVVYKPNQHFRWYTRAEQNYRFAKVDEHTNPVFGQPVGLENQTGISYETGMDYTGKRYAVSARWYRLDLNDEISNDANNFLANINLDKTRRIGSMLSAEISPNNDTRLGLSYEYIDSKITSGPHNGSLIPLVAKSRASAFAEWWVLPDLRLRADAVYVGKRVLGSDYANTDPKLDSYTLVNLLAHYENGPWLFNARLNNVFDREYNASGAKGFAHTGYNPAPERNFMLSIQYNFD